jgi:hypothetical protein
VPRPTTDFTIDCASGADGATLVTALARHRCDALFAVYASGDDLPIEMGTAGHMDIAAGYSAIYRWDHGVRLLRCTDGLLSFEAEPGFVTHLPLVGPAQVNETGISELILTLL